MVNLGTHEALGLRPTTFEDFARRNAAIFLGERAPSRRWEPDHEPAETTLAAS